MRLPSALFFFLLNIVHIYSQSPIIETKLGKIQGFEYTTRNGMKTEIYLNIPFAKPPLGTLRFEKPVPIDAWSNVRDGTSFGFDCVPHVKTANMPGRNVSEDCLTLNVFRPKNANSSSLFPVFVWIHGGGFETGSASFMGFKAFADNYVSKDIVVVTIQYRLAVLGFFSSGSLEIPGNLGLWDMTMALKFVNEHISAFGGDPLRVTAAGESAGGCAAGQMALSPHSRDLISGTIEISGSPLSSFAYGEKVKFHSQQLAEALGCSFGPTLKRCLKTKTLDEIYDAVLRIGYTTNDLQSMKWTPVVDGDFMPDYATNLIRNQNLTPKPSLIGVNSKETGYFVLMGQAKFIQNASISPNDMQTFSQTKLRNEVQKLILKEYYKRHTATALRNIENMYISTRKVQETSGYWLDKYSQIGTDLLFIVPAAREIKAKRLMGWPVFAYSFEHYKDEVFEQMNIPKEARGAVHTSQYAYMLDMARFTFTPEDFVVKNALNEAIVSFTKTGVPSFGVNQTSFPKNKQIMPYLTISSIPKVKAGFYTEQLNFWNQMCTLGFDLVSMTKTDGNSCSADIDFGRY